MKTSNGEAVETQTFCVNLLGEATGPREPTEEREAQEGETSELPEVPATGCTSNPELPENDCALEEQEPEDPTELARRFYGISDNNWLFKYEQTEAEKKIDEEEKRQIGVPIFFNYFGEVPLIKELHAKIYRRIVPWDMVPEAELYEKHESNNFGASRRLQDVEKWIEAVRNEGAEPYVSFDDACTEPNPGEPALVWANPIPGHQKELRFCAQLPTTAEYLTAVQRFVNPTAAHSVLATVKNFTAMNEPNLLSKNPDREYVKPTHTLEGAKKAGEYWRALDLLCVHRGCVVAAGDFSDEAMTHPAVKDTPGYEYFWKYVEGMGKGKATQAHRWAWHSYGEGKEIANKGRLRNKPKLWWTSFHQFQRAVNTVASLGRFARPNIWLSEQGVYFFFADHPEAGWTRKGAAREVMNAFVNHGRGQLTRQLGGGQELQITRFLYYSTRGAPAFDTGLLEPLNTPENAKHEELPHKPDHPRSIYCIYRARTPGGPCPH